MPTKGYIYSNLQLFLQSSVIIAILAVSWTVAAKAQYQLPPSVEQQDYSFSPEGVGYFPSQDGFDGYSGRQTQRVNQDFGDGARSSTTFNFGPRKVAVQVNHQASEAFVDYGGQHGVPNYQFNPSPQRRVLNQFDQNYQLQNNPASQNNFVLPNTHPNTDYNVQPNPNYNNQPNAGQNLLSITNPINGYKYSLEQPTWDKNAYNLNVNYKNEQTPQVFKNSPPSPPAHNFQFHNGFVPQPNFFSHFGQQNPSQRGYVINNGQVYSNPSVPFINNQYNSNLGFSNPQQYPNYEVHDPNQPKIAQKIIYPRPSLNNFRIDSHFNRGRFENERPHVKNTVQTLPQLPTFESTKITTKQEIVKNYTVITSIDEEAIGDSLTTMAPTITLQQDTPVSTDLPIVEDAKLKAVPNPTIVQPSTSFERQNAFYKNLLNVPDYSNLYRSQQVNPTDQPAQTVSQEYKLFFQSTPGYATSSNPAQRFQRPGDLYIQSTPRPLQQSNYAFYQTTAAPQVNNLQGLLPEQAAGEPSLNGKIKEVNTFEDINQKQETLYSVNGFEENVTETAKEESLLNTEEEIEQSTVINDKLTEAYVITEFTTKAPQSLTPFQSIFAIQNINALSNRNGFQLPTTHSTNRAETVSGETQPIVFEPTLPVQTTSPASFEIGTTQERNEEPPSHQIYYGSISSSTPLYTPATKENVVTEASVPIIREPPVDVQSTVTSGYESEVAKRRKKIRVYKKPVVDEEIRDQEHFTVRARVSKNYNGYSSSRIRPTQPTTSTASTPITTPRFVPRGKYHATIPQRHEFDITLSSTQSITQESQTQAIASEYNDYATTSQPFVPTAPRRGQYSPFRQSHSQIDSDSTTIPQNTDSVPPRRYQSRQRFRPKVSRGQAHVSTETQSNVNQDSTNIIQTHQTETPIDNTETITESGQEFTTQTIRSRRPYQRGESVSKEGRPVFSLKKHNFNGRLRVMSSASANQEDLEERKQGRYHAKYPPQRQVIKRIKVKPYQKSESTEEDQDASGSVRTTYENNQEQKEGRLDRKLVSSATVRNSILFPPRKPLTRFNIGTTTEEIKQEISTEMGVTLQTYLDTTLHNDNPDTTIIARGTTEHTATEKSELLSDSTTAKVTEKRQTVDDPDVEALIKNKQNLHEKTESEEKSEDHVDHLTMIKELTEKLQGQSSEEKESLSSDGKDELESSEEIRWEEDQSSPVSDYTEDTSNINTGILNPVKSEIVPSVIPEISPSQNPSDIVTRIDVVTSISEYNGQNNQQSSMIENINQPQIFIQ